MTRESAMWLVGQVYATPRYVTHGKVVSADETVVLDLARVSFAEVVDYGLGDPHLVVRVVVDGVERTIEAEFSVP